MKTHVIKYDEIVFGYNNYAFDDRILCLELRRSGNILEENFRVKDDKILSLDVLQQVRRFLSPKTKDKNLVFYQTISSVQCTNMSQRSLAMHTAL